jgi:hypothetical protein
MSQRSQKRFQTCTAAAPQLGQMGFSKAPYCALRKRLRRPKT